MLEPRRGADLAHETQGLGEPGEQLGRDGGPAISRWKRALPHLLVRVRGKKNPNDFSSLRYATDTGECGRAIEALMTRPARVADIRS